MLSIILRKYMLKIFNLLKCHYECFLLPLMMFDVDVRQASIL